MDQCRPSMSKVSNTAWIMADTLLCCSIARCCACLRRFCVGNSKISLIATILPNLTVRLWLLALRLWLWANSLHANYRRFLPSSHRQLQTPLVTALTLFSMYFSGRGEILGRERERPCHLRGGRSQGPWRAAHARAICLRSRSGEPAVGGCSFRLVSARACSYLLQSIWCVCDLALLYASGHATVVDRVASLPCRVRVVSNA